MKPSRTIQFAFVVVLACLSVVGIAGAQTLKVPFASLSPNYAPLWVADAANLFKKHHLDVQIIYISAGSVIVPAMLSGEVRIANMAAPAAMTAWARGADLALVAVGTDRLLHVVMTSPKIKKPEELKGKKVASDRYGSLSDLALREALRYYKLTPDKDVAIIQAGGLPERLGALKVGAVDGAMLTGDSRLQAEKLGFRAVIDLSQLPIRYPSSSIVVRKQFLQGNSGIVKSFLKAWIEGTKILKTDKDFSIRVFKRYLKTDDSEILEKTYQTYQAVHEKSPYPNRAVIQLALDRLSQTSPEAAKLNVDDFIDAKLVRELDNEGFIQEVYSERPSR